MRLPAGEIPRRATTIGLSLFLLAGLAFLWIETAKFARPLVKGAPSSAFFPRLTIAFLILTVGLLLLREVRSRALEGDTVALPVAGLLLALVPSALYALLLPYGGFELLTVAFVAGQLSLNYRLWVSIAAGIATMLVMWAVFVLALQIDMPLLFLPKYL